MRLKEVGERKKTKRREKWRRGRELRRKIMRNMETIVRRIWVSNEERNKGKEKESKGKMKDNEVKEGKDGGGEGGRDKGKTERGREGRMRNRS